MRILILGATGMLGHSLFSNLRDYEGIDVFGTVRHTGANDPYFDGMKHALIENVDVLDSENIERAVKECKPDIVLNCIGLIKQHDVSKQHISAVAINALLPHQIAKLCDKYKARLIHFSTDCVFDGQKGLYIESDLPNSTDLYGKSKCLGEVDYGQHLTLRTSIIGHELNSAVSLIDWFLSQKNMVKGFRKAVFSGLPTCFIAKLLVDHVFQATELKGLYHLSVEPIDKFSLISLVAQVYNKDIEIEKSTELVVDRSLNSERFRAATGFVPPSWQELIEFMHADYLKRYV
ncbi:SDR family oxidoreductase [uncultured Vibrio sp.]|uniref:dTDP-4-dehydrorhamnose reductase family protein n=1 Tax=uncultured Vibrio sp. TaxID=114054 RepID=UPI000915EAB6|nr:SDR family oxidoreductase [uncultured Vibrio sp.]OIQ25319.1 MAG: NAD(P)-dependent oxidoreductase [Vibrio sp. MedPE-SWchi]